MGVKILKNDNFISTVFGSKRIFGISRGMKIFTVEKDYNRCNIEVISENIVKFEDVSLIHDSGVIVHICFYPGARVDDVIDVFGTRYFYRDMNIGGVADALVTIGVGFSYRHESFDGSEYARFITEYRDEFIFDRNDGIFSLSKIFSVLI